MRSEKKIGRIAIFRCAFVGAAVRIASTSSRAWYDRPPTRT
jgi:hypothetical protein